jgi:hypothetical protein
MNKPDAEEREEYVYLFLRGRERLDGSIETNEVERAYRKRALADKYKSLIQNAERALERSAEDEFGMGREVARSGQRLGSAGPAMSRSTMADPATWSEPCPRSAGNRR